MDEQGSGPSVNGRTDGTVVELDFGRIDLGLVDPNSGVGRFDGGRIGANGSLEGIGIGL